MYVFTFLAFLLFVEGFLHPCLSHLGLAVDTNYSSRQFCLRQLSVHLFYTFLTKREQTLSPRVEILYTKHNPAPLHFCDYFAKSANIKM